MQIIVCFATNYWWWRDERSDANKSTR